MARQLILVREVVDAGHVATAAVELEVLVRVDVVKVLLIVEIVVADDEIFKLDDEELLDEELELLVLELD